MSFAPPRPKSESGAAVARAEGGRAIAPGRGSGVPLFLQTKLKVNQPGDELEKEADQVAQEATGQQPPAGAGPVRKADEDQIQRRCSQCQEEEEKEKKDKKVQRKEAGPSPAPAAAKSGLDFGGGSELPLPVRRKVEPVLGHDLGHVRVHHDAESRQTASALNAKAFTHRNHIWLGENQSADDVDLLAHEATHVVQQGAGRASEGTIQRRESTNDGDAPRSRLFAKIEKETGKAVPAAKPKPADPNAPKPAEDPEIAKAKAKIDPAEKQKKRGQSEGDAKPNLDRPGQQLPKVQATALETKQQADAPPKPIGTDAQAAGKKKDKDKGKAGGDGKPASAADMAFSAAGGVAQPDAPPPLTIPQPVSPVDAGGQPLPADPAADMQAQSIAMEAQTLREQGLRLRQGAAEMRANAYLLQGNMELVSEGVAGAEAGVKTAQDQSKARHANSGQAAQGLAISEQKAEHVAKEAPAGVEEASSAKKESSATAGEATSLAGESASQNADDEEAGEKSAENAGKMNSVSSDIGSIDGAVGQAETAAKTLVSDAEGAKKTNTKTAEGLTSLDAVLEETDTKITEQQTQNSGARQQLAAHASGPSNMLAQAQALDDQGAALIALSADIESQLAGMQQNYASGMSAIPKEEVEEEGGGEAEVQREPEEGKADQPIDLAGALPEWMTGEQKPSDAEREQAYLAQQEKRQADLDRINSYKEGGFESLDAGDKMLLSLKMTGSNLFGGVGKISWPGWGKVGEGAAHLIIGIFDPRTALTGVLGGLNMILNSSVEFFKQPSWGGALKLAADVATGITIILGSIVALAGTIAAIMTAISILSFGTLAPICGPVIAFCATVMSTVGGWTLWAGAVALSLRFLVFLKDLYAAATAKTANELANVSDAMTDNAKQSGNVLMQMGMAKLGQMGGRGMQSQIQAAGGGVNFARGVASKSLLGEAGQGFTKSGTRGFLKAFGQGAGKRLGGLGKGIGKGLKGAGKAVTSPVETMKKLREAWKAARSAPKSEPMTWKEGTSKDFLVGKPAQAAEEASGVAKVADDLHAPQSKPNSAAKAQESHLQGTANKEGAQLTPDELAKDKAIADTRPKQKSSEPGFQEKTELPNGHEVHGDGQGGFCRFSKKTCGGFLDQKEAKQVVSKISKDAKIARSAEEAGVGAGDIRRFFEEAGEKGSPNRGLAEKLAQEAKAGKITDETAAELREALKKRNPDGRYTVDTPGEVNRLERLGPPNKPPNLTAEEELLWKDYVDYYNKRVKRLKDDLDAGRPLSEKGPQTWKSYKENPLVLGEFQRGAQFNETMAKELDKAKTFEGAKITAKDSEVVIQKGGETYRPDHLIETGTGNFTSISNKSRTFNYQAGGALDQAALSRQVREDVIEMIDKYATKGNQKITLGSRKPGFGGRYGEKIQVKKAVINYDPTAIKLPPGMTQKEFRELVENLAATHAANNAPASITISVSWGSFAP